MTLRALGWRFWLRFALACSVVQGGEIAVHHLSTDQTELSPLGDTFLVLSGAYNRLISAPRPPIVRYTTIIEINPSLDIPSITAMNVCGQRAFLARLLMRLDRADPRVIVIDKYFGRHTCDPQDSNTKALYSAIEEIRKRRPLIVGLLSLPLPPSERERRAASNYIVDHLKLPPGADGPQEGLINVPGDTRRLPLQWSVFPDRRSADIGLPITVDALPLIAARHADPHLNRTSERLADLLRSGEHPYVGLLAPSRYIGHRYFASEIVCGRRLGDAEDWRACDDDFPVPPDLKGRVVVIGEDNAQLDQHRSAVGSVPGFYLQAGYIEAILDDRLYRPAGRFADIGVSFAILFALELVLALTHGSFWKGFVLSTATLAVCVFLVYMLVLHTGYYLDPFLVTGVAVAIKVLHPLFSFAKPQAAP